MILKIGSRGKEVKELQEFLGVQADGIFGKGTDTAVRNWQQNQGLIVDGIVGPATWDAMGIASTDISEQIFETKEGLTIEKHYLPKGEYKVGPTNKEYIFLHHTAGWHNPFKTIDQWSRDDRGAIATEFVLGGPSVKGNDNKYDGKMVQAFPEGGYGWHLGKTGSGYMNQHSVGLEICSIGYLDGQYRSYVNKKAKDDQVISLTQLFRSRQHWHKYSDKQIEETAKLIKYVADRDNIDVRAGLQKWIKDQGPIKAFGFQEDAYYGKVKGLLSHTNVRKDKTDVYPDPRLIEVIINL